MLDILDQLAAVTAVLIMHHQTTATDLFTDPHTLEWIAVPFVWGYGFRQAAALF